MGAKPRCIHGLPEEDCELCKWERETAEDQATDSDWYDEDPS